MYVGPRLGIKLRPFSIMRRKKQSLHDRVGVPLDRGRKGAHRCAMAGLYPTNKSKEWKVLKSYHPNPSESRGWAPRPAPLTRDLPFFTGHCIPLNAFL